MKVFSVFLAAALPAIAAAQQNPILSVEGPFTPTVTCPPDSLFHWKKTHAPAVAVLWAVPRNDWDVIGPYVAVTSWVGRTAIIYARTNLAMTPDATAFHEFCHAQGWSHEETRGVRPDARFAQ